jgi:glutathione S-transferase
MILVGLYDSPFVRRVAVALNHYDIGFERRILSVFQDFGDVQNINPLGKVPALILPDGEQLYDSRAIIEYLENTADTKRKLTPEHEPDLRKMLAIEAVGIGLAEKTYERGIEFSRRAPGTQDPAWVSRLESQIEGALNWLEEQLNSNWFVGGQMTRADLAVVAALTYLHEKLPVLFDESRLVKLSVYRQRCEKLPEFSAAAYSANEAIAAGWVPE